MNVSEFTDVSRATDTLISAVQAFGYTADTSMEVVDLLNIIGNNYAISTADLATSLTKSSASLVAAGGDLAEAAALTATANAIIQDADVVGTALKTTSLRLRGTDTKTLDEEGLDTEGVVTSKSKLRGKIQALSGVDILTNTGAYKSTYEILKEIAAVWENMNDMDQAALLELISGKRNASVVAAILQNPKQLEAAYEDAQNAAGSAMKENEKYLDSIQGRIDLLNNAIQTMWSNTLDDKWIKFFINIATKLIEIVDNIGLVRVAFMALGAYLSKNSIKMNWSNGIVGAIKNISNYKKGIKELTVAQKNLKTAQERAADSSGKSAKEIWKLQDGVKRAKARVKELSKEQIKAGKLGNQSFKSLGKSVLNFGKNLTEVLSSMAIMYVVSEIITGITNLFEKVIKAFEKSDEIFNDLSSEVSETDSKINDLESQLENVNEQIKEINENVPLNFTDQQTLSLLREESQELEYQIKLTKLLKEQQQQKLNQSATDAANKYKETNLGTGKSNSGNIWSKTGKGALYGGAAASAIGAAEIGALVGSTVPVVGTIVGLLVGALVGAVGGAIVGTIQNSKDKTVGNSLDSMQEEYAKLKNEYTKAQEDYQFKSSDKNYNKLKEAQEKLSEYEGQMSSTLLQLQEYYGSIDWESATLEQREAIQEFYDTQDKWAIQSGTQDAKNSALTRIFGENADETIKKAKEAYIEALNDGKNPTLEEIFGYIDGGEEAFNTLRDRLYDIGIYIAEAESYLIDFKKAKDEVAEDDFDGIAKSVSTISDELSDLKNAFSEVTENGIISAKTMSELIDKYSGIESISDEWENYVKVMMSGTASTKEMEEATRNLAEAMVDSAFENSGPLSATEKLSWVAQLTSLGVQNAKEYVEDANEEAAWDRVYSLFGLDDDKNIKIPSDSEIETKLKEYGVEATAYKIAKAKAKLQERYEKQQKFDKLNSMASLVTERNSTQNKLNELNNLSPEEAAKVKDLENQKAELEAKLKDLNVKIAETEATSEVNELVKQKEELQTQIDGIKDNFTQHTRQVMNTAGTGFVTQTYYTDVDGNEYTEAEYNTKIKELKDQKASLEAQLADLNTQIAEKGGDINFDVSAVEAEADAIQAEIDNIDNYIDTEITADVELNLELQNPSDLVDKLQSVYDTLNNAMEEYKKQGYFNVDTVQSLLEIEPKYLQVLYDENGQLKANASDLYALTAARVNDMGIQAAQDLLKQARDALNNNEIEKMKELTEVTYGLTSANWSMYDSMFAILQADAAQAGYGDFGASIYRQYLAIRNMTQSAASNIQKSISSSNASETANDAFERAMKYWENRIGAKESEYQQIQNEIDLLEKQGKYAGQDYYKEQIRLENEKLALLQQQKAEAQSYLGAFKEGSDEWFQK